MRGSYLEAVIVLGLVLAPMVAGADDDDSMMDRLQAAVARGDARPLSELLRGLRAAFPGEVIDVEIEEHDDRPGRFLYQFKVLQKSGRRLDIKVDAATGAVIGVDRS